MSDSEAPENFKDLWDKLEDQELQLHAIEDLAQLLDQAKAVETANEIRVTTAGGSDQSTAQIDRLFQHVIGRIHEESKHDISTLAKRLVALNRLEKGFVSLLVARIDALEQRIHHLQREQSRLERIIHDSSHSILRLFTGVRSQFQLKNVKAELRTLNEEKLRVWQKKEAFNSVRERLLSKSKAGARTVLQERRERGLYLLQDRLIAMIDEALEAAEAADHHQHGFHLSESSQVGKGHLFGRFVRGLSPKEKAFVDKASDVNSYGEGEDGLLEELHSVMQEIHPDANKWLPNRCLFLGKLLAKQGEGCLVPTEKCVDTYKLFEKTLPTLEAVQALLLDWPELARIRLVQLVRLIHRICALNSKAHPKSSVAVSRKALARIFRDLLICDADVTAGLSGNEKPTSIERRRHQERVNRALDDMLRFMVDHTDELGFGK